MLGVGYSLAPWGAGGGNTKGFLGHESPGLSDFGEQQAAEAAALLSDLLRAGRLPQPRCVWSSDLQRAAQTASVVAEKFSLAIHEKLAIREIDFGSWDGLTFAEVDARYNGAASFWFRDPLHRFPVNGKGPCQRYLSGSAPLPTAP